MNKIFDLPRRAGSASMKLLREIAAALDDQDTVVLPWIVRCSIPFPDELEAELSYEKRERRIRGILRQLKRQRFIEIRKAGEQLEIALTDKGAALGLIEKIKSRPSENCGRLLLVSFDIPEQERARRKLLTRRLKYAGFEKMHASLWSTDKDVRSDLERLIKLLDTKNWIRLYEASEITPK